MSISKPFNQHRATINRRSKSYLIVRISSDTVTGNYGQVWLQFAMTACILSLRPLAMLLHARGPEAATIDCKIDISLYRMLFQYMITSSNGIIFCVTGLLCGEFISHG